MTEPRRVLHVIIGLHTGGAEMMLHKLLGTLDRERFAPTVAALMDGGSVSTRIGELGVPVHHLGMASPLHAPRALARLRRLAQKCRPHLVQGWMYHGNAAATLAAGWAPGGADLLWNIRHSLGDIGREKTLTRGLIHLGARWSGRPRAVIHNATVSIAQHAAVGYGTDNAVMIPNGFDLQRFRPDPSARVRLRERLGLSPEAVLVGALGRRHPMKGHEVLLEAAGAAGDGRPNVHFVLAGRGVTGDDADLARLAAAPGLAGRVHLLGPESTPENFLPGLDVFCLASTHGEGFPNVLGEAMACGVPCVTTDVGEAATIVGDTGLVVPPAAAPELAAALGAILDAQLDADPRARAGACREAIASRYGLDRVAGLYADLYGGAAT